MNEIQIERIFTTLADMDRRTSTKLDTISENVSNLKSDVSGLNTWRASVQEATSRFWSQTWPAEQTRLLGHETRIRGIENTQINFSKLDVMEKRLEQIVAKLEETGTKKSAEELNKRVNALEKVAIRANVIWASVSIVAGIGFQLFLHYISK